MTYKEGSARSQATQERRGACLRGHPQQAEVLSRRRRSDGGKRAVPVVCAQTQELISRLRWVATGDASDDSHLRGVRGQFRVLVYEVRDLTRCEDRIPEKAVSVPVLYMEVCVCVLYTKFQLANRNCHAFPDL